jgi:hydroxymethylglutaryl-CoA lyase
MDRIHLVECPRDAIQGWPHKVSTQDKIGYYRTLFEVGFDTLDLGSFVSPRAVPSMANTAKVLMELENESIIQNSSTRSLVIVANERGATQACGFDVVDDLGFPLSLSETFQQRNTGASIDEAFKRLSNIQDLCISSNKRLVVYLSMGFGNPYGDSWHPEMLTEFSKRLSETMSVQVIALSDTVGAADERIIKSVFDTIIPEVGGVEFGAHLHLNVVDGMNKISAAIDAGCRRFDGAIRGIGGCPFAQDALVGNAPTERMIELFENLGLWDVKNKRAWSHAQSLSAEIFSDKK